MTSGARLVAEPLVAKIKVLLFEYCGNIPATSIAVTILVLNEFQKFVGILFD